MHYVKKVIASLRDKHKTLVHRLIVGIIFMYINAFYATKNKAKQWKNATSKIKQNGSWEVAWSTIHIMLNVKSSTIERSLPWIHFPTLLCGKTKWNKHFEASMTALLSQLSNKVFVSQSLSFTYNRCFKHGTSEVATGSHKIIFHLIVL